MVARDQLFLDLLDPLKRLGQGQRDLATVGRLLLTEYATYVIYEDIAMQSAIAAAANFSGAFNPVPAAVPPRGSL